MILKRWGNTRGSCFAYGLEYAILGLITAVIATATRASRRRLRRQGKSCISVSLHASSAAIVAAGVAVFTVAFALFGTGGRWGRNRPGIEEFVISRPRKPIFHRSRNLSGNSLAATIRGPHISGRNRP